MDELNFDNVKSDVIGRWPGVLQGLSVDVPADGKHGACPMCGGKDRFRFDDKEGRGTWFCNSCGAGDGWALVQAAMGCGFVDAIRRVQPLIGSTPPSGAGNQVKRVSPDVLRSIFTGSRPACMDDAVGRYLSGRGLKTIPSTLRCHPGIREPETGKTMPAMIAVVSMPDGTAATIHRTFLTASGQKAPTSTPRRLMPGLRKITGGAIRLFEPTDDGLIGIAEGIETAIAAMEIFKIPTWAAVSATLMAGWDPPPQIRSVVIFADNDENYAGQRAAYDLAHRLKVHIGMTVAVEVPDIAGDWLDELIKMRRAA